MIANKQIIIYHQLKELSHEQVAADSKPNCADRGPGSRAARSIHHIQHRAATLSEQPLRRVQTRLQLRTRAVLSVREICGSERTNPRTVLQTLSFRSPGPGPRCGVYTRGVFLDHGVQEKS